MMKPVIDCALDAFIRGLPDDKGFFNRDITIPYLYMNAPLNFFTELSMSKR